MNKRLPGILLAGLGLAVLLVLTLALVAILGAQGGVPVAQGPYPAGTPQPSLVRVIESPPAPTPRATAIPGAYPPGLRPTITPWPSPTPWPTPVPPPPPRPVGLQIVWAEAEVAFDKGYFEGLGPTTFYVADVGDLAHRKALYTLSTNRWSPEFKGGLMAASLAPDGHTIAFTTYSKGSRSQSSGTLWVLPLDGSQPRELVRGMAAGYQAWSPDSRMLAYLRYTPRQSPPPDKESPPDRPELHVISVDGQEDKTLFAEDDTVLSLVGWTADDRLLYTLSGVRPDVNGLWSTDVASGERTFITALPENSLPKLAPDGRRLLIQALKEVFWLSADGRQQQRVDFPGVTVAAPTLASRLPWAPTPTTWVVDVQWAASSAEVIFPSGRTSWRIGNLDTGAVRDITVAPEPPGLMERLLSVSPDGQWLAVLRGSLTLLKANERFQITVVAPGRFDLFVGWLPGNADGGRP